MFLSRLLLGVPKWKTPKPKKWTRKFNSSYRLNPIENLVKCPSCESVHKLSTICLGCYYDVRTQTSEIKRTMMDYNPFIGERQRPYVPPTVEQQQAATVSSVDSSPIIESTASADNNSRT